MKTQKALLVGNGINRISQPNGWRDLMCNLSKRFVPGECILIKPPYSLVYEQVLYATKENEDAIRKFISKWADSIAPTDLHKRLMQLKCNALLTTNYDYALEKSIKPTFSPKNSDKRKISLFRKQDINDKKVWHLHGEATVKESILLGYALYGTYMKDVKNYVDGRYWPRDKKKPKTFDSLGKKAKDNKFKDDSWVEAFARDNLHILGFDMGYEELHFWYLLSYRCRKAKKRNKSDAVSGMISRFKNKIFYYTPFYGITNNGQSETQRKNALLQALSVCVKPIAIPYRKGEPSWEDYYNMVLDIIENA